MLSSIMISTRSLIGTYAIHPSRIYQPQQRLSSFLFKKKYVSRKRRLKKAKIKEAAEAEEREDTIGEILFGKPPKKPVGFQHARRWPNSITEWKEKINLRWPQYLATFEGYLPWLEDKGTLERLLEQERRDKGLPIESSLANALELWKKNTEKAPQQLEENLAFLKIEGKKALETAKKNTGFHTKEDVKKFAEDMLKLANECLTEFMSGYREGRDSEVEKMLTQYFQELNEAADALPSYMRMKRRGRKPKRIIRSA
jgi:hypothetical protein